MDEIRTTMRKGQKGKLWVLSLLCLASAAYGAWQYWFRLPERERTFATYIAAVEQKAAAEQVINGGGRLDEAQIAEYEKAESTLTTYANDKPQKPSKYDGLISLLVWFAGGLSGLPFLLWPLWKHRNGGWILHEDGVLRSPKGERIPDDQIQDIDMSSWRGLINPQASNKSTWQAKLSLTDGRKIVLDDYPWDGVSRIIAHYAHRFHPDTWDADGEPIQAGLEHAAGAFQSSDADDPPSESSSEEG